MISKRGYLYVLLLVLVIGYISTLQTQDTSITGKASQVPTESRATIQRFFDIVPSEQIDGDNPNDGIIWSNIDTQGGQIPVNDAPADGNEAGDPPMPAPATAYSIKVHQDSNVNLDFCVRASGDLISGGFNIPIANERFDDDLSSGSIPGQGPLLIEAQSLTTTNTLVQTGRNVPPGISDFYRFWLSVPAPTRAGTYTNSVFITAILTGNGCP